LFFHHNINVKESIFLECELNLREQRGMDSYRKWQISQSDCEISCNCGEKNNLSTKMLTGKKILQTKTAKIKHVVKLQFIHIITTIIYDLG